MRNGPTASLIALIAAALLLPPPSSASEQNAEQLESCLHNAFNQKDRMACIGTISDPCQSTPEGSKTAGLAECFAEEASAWNVLLDRYWTDLKKQAAGVDASNAGFGITTPKANEALLSAQRGWLAYRDGRCNYYYARFALGTIRNPMAAGCRMHMTAERVIDFYIDLNNKILND
ncbi:MAG: lysozyme inhibitor LprI family protein [Pseudomonadota bacterium]